MLPRTSTDKGWFHLCHFVNPGGLAVLAESRGCGARALLAAKAPGSRGPTFRGGRGTHSPRFPSGCQTPGPPNHRQPSPEWSLSSDAARAGTLWCLVRGTRAPPERLQNLAAQGGSHLTLRYHRKESLLMTKPILGVGWDVGGWCGSKQAVAVAISRGRSFCWLGSGGCTFSLGTLDKGQGLRGLIRTAWKRCPHDVFDRYRVIVAIDAPFRFPQGFVKFLKGGDAPRWDSGREIDNPLAYRACDQVVFRAFNKKKPLSASFDKLGNNTTVAMTHLRLWRRTDNARVLPFDDEEASLPTIIEVYPALAKARGEKNAHRKLRRLVAGFGRARSDEYDAAICAVLAVAFGVDGEQEDLLPPMRHPPLEFSIRRLKSEGWIYYPSPLWLGVRYDSLEVHPDEVAQEWEAAVLKALKLQGAEGQAAARSQRRASSPEFIHDDEPFRSARRERPKRRFR
jgi:predicted nuclease with RNAse H fold